VQTQLWPAEAIVARGYAAAAFLVSDVAPDRSDTFNSGVFPIFNPPSHPRTSDSWGAIAAWAWGASRAVDYLVADPDLDPARIAGRRAAFPTRPVPAAGGRGQALIRPGAAANADNAAAA